MRSFSKLELLKDKLKSESKTLWQILKEPNYKYIELVVPYYDYLRGDILLMDMKKVIDNCPSIDIADLIYILYLQFLHQVRKGTKTVNNKKQGLDLMNLSYKLVELKNRYSPPKLVEKRITRKLNEISPTTWLFEDEEEEIESEPTKDKPKNAYLTIRIKAQEIYRGEVLLYDLHNLNPDIDFDVEELMAFLFIDFIKIIKHEGNDERIMQSIVSSYEYYKNY